MSGDLIVDPIKNPLLRDRIYEMIWQAILRKELLPGDRIVESKLARQLEVSQGPVREALQRLAAEGVVVTLARTGSFVRTMREEDLRDVYQVREALECLAIDRLIANGIDEAGMGLLEQRYDELVEAASKDDPIRVVELDLVFHQTIIQLAGNPFLVEAIRPLFAQTAAFISVTNIVFFDDLRVVAEAHLPLLEAVRSGDADRATALLRAHVSAIWKKTDGRPDP